MINNKLIQLTADFKLLPYQISYFLLHYNIFIIIWHFVKHKSIVIAFAPASRHYLWLCFDLDEFLLAVAERTTPTETDRVQHFQLSISGAILLGGEQKNRKLRRFYVSVVCFCRVSGDVESRLKCSFSSILRVRIGIPSCSVYRVR